MRRVFFILVAAAGLLAAQTSTRHSVQPKDGFVPDASTAIRIAEAVWIPVYGERTIARERPFKAKLKTGTWIVEGSLPAGFDGGVAVAEISKKDGKILRVSHGK